MNLLADLATEQACLDTVLTGLTDDQWLTPTPAEGWDVQDSVAHLAWTDELAVIALTDPRRFEAIKADPAPTVDVWMAKGRTADAHAWWREARMQAINLLRERVERVPWGTGAMSVSSFVTARLMEAWAHGQDVRDALALAPSRSDRLRHIADLGMRTREFSYRVRGLEPPLEDVRVELDEGWMWGQSTSNVVRGSALDFCLVVTQRRHPDDTDLLIAGNLAGEWMAIAQAFAGPPTGPRERSWA